MFYSVTIIYSSKFMNDYPDSLTLYICCINHEAHRFTAYGVKFHSSRMEIFFFISLCFVLTWFYIVLDTSTNRKLISVVTKILLLSKRTRCKQHLVFATGGCNLWSSKLSVSLVAFRSCTQPVTSVLFLTNDSFIEPVPGLLRWSGATN